MSHHIQNHISQTSKFNGFPQVQIRNATKILSLCQLYGIQFYFEAVGNYLQNGLHEPFTRYGVCSSLECFFDSKKSTGFVGMLYEWNLCTFFIIFLMCFFLFFSIFVSLHIEECFHFMYDSNELRNLLKN